MGNINEKIMNDFISILSNNLGNNEPFENQILQTLKFNTDDEHDIYYNNLMKLAIFTIKYNVLYDNDGYFIGYTDTIPTPIIEYIYNNLEKIKYFKLGLTNGEIEFNTPTPITPQINEYVIYTESITNNGDFKTNINYIELAY